MDTIESTTTSSIPSVAHDADATNSILLPMVQVQTCQMTRCIHVILRSMQTDCSPQPNKVTNTDDCNPMYKPLHPGPYQQCGQQPLLLVALLPLRMPYPCRLTLPSQMQSTAAAAGMLLALPCITVPLPSCVPLLLLPGVRACHHCQVAQHCLLMPRPPSGLGPT